MSALTDARTRLFDALAPVFVEPVGGYQFTGRVYRTPPAKLAAPSVYLGMSDGVRQTGPQGGPRYVATWPVWIVYDGANADQVDGLEEVIGRVHDAANAAGMVATGHTNADPPLPAGATTLTSTLRGVVVTVDATVRAVTLCPVPVLEATA